MENWQKTPYLIPFSFMSLSEFDFLCCYDPHTNEESMAIADALELWWVTMITSLFIHSCSMQEPSEAYSQNKINMLAIQQHSELSQNSQTK
ncbi:hypothetical protein NC651_037287 [Populus alba x Populus x berolinensis]|nr:hypothetical protein NC651_037259 [Populus alba x Populus x berolinensis]KAJ6861138.1 hypothetical protein NC651_037270 [Populus alba x Populus x berolinensis]KAJ6861159.1 hypothetical protein NC651_037287 [Populus alba x Populus x berolinensis]